MESVKEYSKFLVLSFVAALILLCLTGVIFAYTSINDSLINVFVFVIVVVTNLIGSTLLTHKIKRRGLVLGLIFGIIYFLIIYVISTIFYTGFFVNKEVGIYMLLSAISGMVGGIVGVNIR